MSLFVSCLSNELVVDLAASNNVTSPMYYIYSVLIYSTALEYIRVF